METLSWVEVVSFLEASWSQEGVRPNSPHILYTISISRGQPRYTTCTPCRVSPLQQTPIVENRWVDGGLSLLITVQYGEGVLYHSLDSARLGNVNN